ncbi:Uncharacterized protein TCM_002500 [Theobroma cacao]|uniref:Reverse transcriptase n=1 Tax=Theobroma cacao TaxID=3641 RepID=A0A061DNG7_THECC|nr:Uncharacterized protein TCM_002500 [Theobroma cacao]
MAALKASGPDGLPTLFFQRFRDVMGSSIHRFVTEFLEGRTRLEGINHTFVALIPKVPHLELGRMGNFALKLDMSKAYD